MERHRNHKFDGPHFMCIRRYVGKEPLQFLLNEADFKVLCTGMSLLLNDEEKQALDTLEPPPSEEAPTESGDTYMLQLMTVCPHNNRRFLCKVGKGIEGKSISTKFSDCYGYMDEEIKQRNLK